MICVETAMYTAFSCPAPSAVTRYWDSCSSDTAQDRNNNSHSHKTRSNTAGVATELHWANLTTPTMIIFDWEGWGRMPVGYDPGLLHAYSLTVPSVAARVRHEFADVLGTPADRAGELVAL